MYLNQLSSLNGWLFIYLKYFVTGSRFPATYATI